MAFLDQRLDIGHLFSGEGVVFLPLGTCRRVVELSVVVEHLIQFSALLPSEPLKTKRASSNRFVSVERLSVAKRLLLWQISGNWGSDKA